MSNVRAIHGDSREVLRTLADCSIDAVVCDPPYALVSIGKRFGKDGAAPAKAGKTGAYARASAGFMNKRWDTGETAFASEFWAEVYRVLKPGAFVCAFGGDRTFHRLYCAIEDAGFEPRHTIAWLFGSGFPKSHSIAKATKNTEWCDCED
jgi:site-specific DNA-methyltransferase (adenine-specific)